MTKKAEFEANFNNNISPYVQDVEGYIKTLKEWNGAGQIVLKLYTEKELKSIKAHRYFVGVVCPCVCHAHFEAGNISKAMFKSLKPYDCMEAVKQVFFKKERIGQNTWKYYSLKVADWSREEWAQKVKSIIDTIEADMGYLIPNSNVKHNCNFLKRLQESV